MTDRVRKVTYLYVTLPNRPGQAAKVLGDLKQADVGLLALTGFPGGAGRAQLDLVTESAAACRKLARKQGWSLSAVKKAFLIQGDDVTGAAHRHVQKLATERIGITAANAVSSGKGRYGMILWVKPKDYGRAARILGAR